ncbi:reductase [Pilimelia anulata]|uniref:Reductase n=1 Tax=Pilimelia anulata TaxID=53371 RepID=A0A8J3B8V8_9ACTN|nr:reductase [Pilimelia anulata]
MLGGTGFLGRHACAALRAAGYAVLAVARHPPGAGFGHPFRTLDLGALPPAGLAAAVDELGPDVVVNAVGSIWGRTDAQMWAAAAAPTLRLLDGLALAARRPRLVHIGSVLEYGQGRPGALLDAATPARPTSAYGRAKLAATEAVLARARAGEQPGVVLRIVNLAGPGSPEVSLLGRVASRILAARGRRAVVELDPLLAYRDYVDVRDVADAVVAAAGAPVSGELINIGRGETVRVRSLVDRLIACSGRPVVVVERTGLGIRHSTEDRLRVDIAPAARLLGWRPARPLAGAVADFWTEYVRSHENGEPTG